MSKSLWSRSVWNSLFNRTGGNRLRRKLRPSLQNATGMETLETRVVLAGTPVVAVSFNDSTGVLSLVGAAPARVEVKAGATFTDVVVNSKYTTRMNGVDSSLISTITYNATAGAGTADSLSVVGITTPLTITLTDVEKLQLNSGNVTVNSLTTGADLPLTLVTSTVNGFLTVNHDGAIVQSGKLLVSGTTTIDTTYTGAAAGPRNDITLKTAGNSFGNLVLKGANININETGPTNFGTTSASGNLVVVSSGAITALGTLTIDDGAATPGTGAGNISLTSNGSSINVSGSFDTTGSFLVLKGTDITLTDSKGGTDIVAVTATGDFTLISSDTAGSVGHSSKNVTVGGLAKITAGDGTAAGSKDIDISAGSNNFGSIDFLGNDITILEKSSTSIASLQALNNGTAGNLSLTAKGSITDTGTVTVTGTSLLSASGNEIKLDEANTFGGTISFLGSKVTLNDTDASTTLGALGTLTNSTAKGDFILTSGGVVNQTAALIVTGRLNIDAVTTIDLLTHASSASNKFGSISVDGTTIQVKEFDSSDLFTSTATGDFTLVSGGAVTDSGTLDLLKTTITAAAGKSITLDDGASTFGGAISLQGKDASVLNNDTGGSLLGTTTLTGNYYLHSFGDVSQVNATASAIIVTGRMTVDAENNSIALGVDGVGVATANFGSLSLFTQTGTAQTVDIVEDSSTNLYNSTIDGTFTLTSGGAVTDSGTLTINGTTTITATGFDIILDSKTSQFTDGTTADLTLDGANVSVTDNDSATLLGLTNATGTLTITSSGAITQSDKITTGAKATFTAGGDITLNDTDNAFGTSVSLFGDNAILVEDAGVELGTSKVDGLDVTSSSGAITQSGTVVANGLAKFNAATSITLQSAGNYFDTLQLTSGASASIKQTGNTQFANTSTVGGALTVVAGGNITDSGTAVLDVTDATSLTASIGGVIDLTTATSKFGDTLSLKGAAIKLTDSDGATDLLLVSTPGNFDLTTTGASTGVVQTGGITVGGIATITATGLDIVLDQTGGSNNFDSIFFSGAIVEIAESSDTDIEANSAATSTLTITSSGNITGLGPVTATSTTTLNAGAGAGSIDLSDTGSHFGDLMLIGATATIHDAGGTKLLFGTDISSSLTLITTGNVTQEAGGITVGDLFAVSTTGNVVLDDAANEFTLLAAHVTGNVTILDSDGGIDLTSSIDTGTFNITGFFTLTEKGLGDVTDSAPLTILGVTTITDTTHADSNIILDEAGSKFVTVVLVGVDIELRSYSDVALNLGDGSNDIYAGGTLTIYAYKVGAGVTAGDITQTSGSQITAIDNATIVAEGQLTLIPANLTFNGVDNYFADVDGLEVY